jgi:drug/metabolite transporter (DMT)-like permease
LNKIIKAHLALIGANVIFGLNFIIAKGIMPQYLDPRSIILLRVTVAVIFFWLFHRAFVKEKVEKRDLVKLAVCGLFGIAINQIFFFEGLNLTTPINSSIIITSIPILVLIFSNLLLKQNITLYKIIGIACGTTGALVIILLQGSISFKSDTFTGNLFIIINSISYALYMVLLKPLLLKYKAITVIKWAFSFGLIFIIPFCIEPALSADWQSIPVNIWLSISFVVIGTTIFTYLLNIYSLKYVNPIVTGSYIYLQPFIATVVALSLGKDTLTIQEVISAILIFSGVYFISIRKKKDIRY